MRNVKMKQRISLQKYLVNFCLIICLTLFPESLKVRYSHEIIEKVNKANQDLDCSLNSIEL